MGYLLWKHAVSQKSNLIFPRKMSSEGHMTDLYLHHHKQHSSSTGTSELSHRRPDKENNGTIIPQFFYLLDYNQQNLLYEVPIYSFGILSLNLWLQIRGDHLDTRFRESCLCTCFFRQAFRGDNCEDSSSITWLFRNIDSGHLDSSPLFLTRHFIIAGRGTES